MLFTATAIRSNASRTNTENNILRNSHNARNEYQEEKEEKRKTTQKMITEDEYMEIIFNSLGE